MATAQPQGGMTAAPLVAHSGIGGPPELHATMSAASKLVSESVSVSPQACLQPHSNFMQWRLQPKPVFGSPT